LSWRAGKLDKLGALFQGIGGREVGPLQLIKRTKRILVRDGALLIDCHARQTGCFRSVARDARREIGASS
jgi:hypothetical protein